MGYLDQYALEQLMGKVLHDDPILDLKHNGDLELLAHYAIRQWFIDINTKQRTLFPYDTFEEVSEFYEWLQNHNAAVSFWVDTDIFKKTEGAFGAFQRKLLRVGWGLYFKRPDPVETSFVLHWS